MRQINGKTKIVGLFGYPVEHSMSPGMHNAGLVKLNLDYVYVAFNVLPDKLGEAVKSIRPLNIRGMNVTIPHKENVMRFLDRIDPVAEQIGAVNAIVNNNGVLTGYNTDGWGFIKSLQNKHINISGKQALLLGAGGAGKAISINLVKSGIRKLYIKDIDKSRVRKLVDGIKKVNKKAGIVQYIDKIDGSIIQTTDLLINATPVGMKPGDNPVIPAALLGINKKLVVYDIVYNRETELAKESIKRGLVTLNGSEMLLYQGVAAFELWTGKKAPVSVMRKALQKQIKAIEF